MDAEKLEQILPRATRNFDAPENLFRMENEDAEVCWPRILEERLRAHSYVFKCVEGKIYIKVDSSVYLRELQMRKSELTRKMVKVTGGRIKELVFRI